MIAIADHPAGCLVPVRAQPHARKTGVLGEMAGKLKLAVAAPPADGKANRALIDLLRDLFGVKRSQIELTAGAASRDKTFLIRGLSADQAARRMADRL